MILSDIARALAQIGDPRFRRVILLGLGLTLALLGALSIGVFWLVGLFSPDVVTLPFIGPVEWVDTALSWGSLVLMLVLSVFLMIPVASGFASMFLDQIADAVEQVHYPQVPPARQVPLVEALRDGLNFLALLIGANLLALIVYLVMLLTVVLAPLAPLVFWALNGFLLGREYFQMVAMRRRDRQSARRLFRANLGQIWLAGLLMAIPLTVPLLNLVVPVVGAAVFTHLYHRLDR